MEIPKEELKRNAKDQTHNGIKKASDRLVSRPDVPKERNAELEDMARVLLFAVLKRKKNVNFEKHRNTSIWNL